MLVCPCALQGPSIVVLDTVCVIRQAAWDRCVLIFGFVIYYAQCYDLWMIDLRLHRPARLNFTVNVVRTLLLICACNSLGGWLVPVCRSTITTSMMPEFGCIPIEYGACMEVGLSQWPNPLYIDLSLRRTLVSVSLANCLPTSQRLLLSATTFFSVMCEHEV